MIIDKLSIKVMTLNESCGLFLLFAAVGAKFLWGIRCVLQLLDAHLGNVTGRRWLTYEIFKVKTCQFNLSGFFSACT